MIVRSPFFLRWDSTRAVSQAPLLSDTLPSFVKKRVLFFFLRHASGERPQQRLIAKCFSCKRLLGIFALEFSQWFFSFATDCVSLLAIIVPPAAALVAGIRGGSGESGR